MQEFMLLGDILYLYPPTLGERELMSFLLRQRAFVVMFLFISGVVTHTLEREDEADHPRLGGLIGIVEVELSRCAAFECRGCFPPTLAWSRDFRNCQIHGRSTRGWVVIRGY